MSSVRAQMSSHRPVYSPRSPVTRVLLVVFIAAFAICAEVISRVLKTEESTASLIADEPAVTLSSKAVH